MKNIKDIKSKFSDGKIKCFIVVLEILSNEWNYKIGDFVHTVIFCKRINSVYDKVDEVFSGSDVPSFKIVSIVETDDSVFYWGRQD
jgi:hypothetical protein